MIEDRFSRISVAIFFSMVMLSALSGCTVGPDYQKPKTQMPAQWGEQSRGEATPVAVDITRWWTVFSDPVLDSLIQRAVAKNKDLIIAEARIREARAQRGVVAADGYPSIDSSAVYSRSRSSENASPSSSGRGGSGGSPTEGSDLFQFGFDAAWEIDIFGRVRRAVEAANADIQFFEEDRRDILVTLLSEVARNYLEVRGSQLRLHIARENIKGQQQTVQLTRDRFAAGLSSELDVARAGAQLASTEAQVPALESVERQAIHQLGVLLGLEPTVLLDELLKEAPIPTTPPEAPTGLPSDLLRRRPDVRRAERQLAGATARIGVATADLFPRFSLTGAVGQQSISFSDLALSGSTFWSIGPTLRWPVFNAGRIRANIKVQDARQEQALAAYEKAVLTSLRDVENALVAHSKEQVSRRSLAAAVDANQRAYEIANELYSKGLVDFLNVLDAQRSLYVSQELLALSDQRIATNLVALFKALGGGWDVVGQ
jgi:NodT family efflux transporter outer membrane factor (OMF) lipoprotein